MLYPPNFWVSVRPSAVDHSCQLHNFDLYLFFIETTITLDYYVSVAVEKEKKEI